MSDWTEQDIPDLHGRVAVVTGANSGLGFHTARALAAHGAQVVMACRDAKKTEEAIRHIKQAAPKAKVQFLPLDLADLASIKAFGQEFERCYSRLDLLCNNAGVMFLPYRLTRDGFEMQMGTNHLGHFALTGVLLNVIRKTSGARVVTVSSGLNQAGWIPLDDFNAQKHYNKYRAYCHSKLANLIFALDLQRRFEKVGIDAISVSAHPGYAATNLQMAGPNMAGSDASKWIMEWSNRLLAQAPEMGALPTLFAATAPDVKGGDYFGPGQLFEIRGYPRPARKLRRAQNETLAAQLWEKSEQLTGVRYLSA